MRRFPSYLVGIALATGVVPLAVEATRGEGYRRVSGPIGTVRHYRVEPNESFPEIARKFDLGFNDIVAANPGVDPYVPPPGLTITIATSWIVPDVPVSDGIVINVPEMRLYLFSGPKFGIAATYPVGIGDQGKETPTGVFTITEKVVNPAWHVPKSILRERPFLPKVVPPGPENPLGTHALRLSAPAVLIHGTNKPWGLGRRVSHGCIRMYPEDIVRLFAQVEVGTRVAIVYQPVKVAERDGRVYVEAHRYEGVDYYYEASKVLGEKGLLGRIDVAKLWDALADQSGIPVDITR